MTRSRLGVSGSASSIPARSRAQRLDLACQAYQLALDAVRLTERRNHPDLSPEALAWRVTRRMQGDCSLGREYDGTRPPQ